jgi:hypothetical protein
MLANAMASGVRVVFEYRYYSTYSNNISLGQIEAKLAFDKNTVRPGCIGVIIITNLQRLV